MQLDQGRAHADARLILSAAATSHGAIMERIESLRQTLPESAKDLKLNIQAVLRPESLSAERAFAIAYASSLFIRADGRLTAALLEDARAAGVSEPLLDDAHAAVAIMGMNTVYYRFRHMAADETYSGLPARLRMQRIARPATTKLDFELLSIALAALAGCEMCINAHEESLRGEGATPDQVHDAVRIASVVAGTDAALRLPQPVAG